MFQMMGVFAEFERAMIQERVRAGLARAIDLPPLKWSDLRYAFDIQEDCNGKEAIQA